MPARKKPVMNLKANTDEPFFASQMIEIFARAAISDEMKKTFEESNLSAIEKMAKTRVPVINPNCTIEVILPNALKGIFNSGRIAFPANHNDVPANCERMIRGRICDGLFCNPFVSVNIILPAKVGQ